MPFKDEVIDKNIPIPMYYQLKNLILKAMKEGKLKPGDAIPTEAEFGEMFSISRTTVRQAIMELVMEGYLHREKSKGTFVSKPKVVQETFTKIRASHALLRGQNMIPTTKVLEMGKMLADAEVAAKLDIAEGSEVVKMSRLRYANEEVILYSDTFVPPLCFDMLNYDMEATGLYEFLDKREETRAVRAVRELEAIVAGRHLSELMGIQKGDPIQQTKDVTYSKDDVPVSYTVTKFRGDRNVFVVELNV